MHFNRKSMEDKETNKEVKELGEILAKSSIDQKRLQAQYQEEKERMEKHLFSEGTYIVYVMMSNQFFLFP